MTGYEPRTSGVGSKRSATEPQPLPTVPYFCVIKISCSASWGALFKLAPPPNRTRWFSTKVELIKWRPCVTSLSAINQTIFKLLFISGLQPKTLNSTSVTREKSPNVHKSCPKMISLEKLKILAPTQKLPKTVRDLGKLIVAKGFKKLPKVQ